MSIIINDNDKCKCGAYWQNNGYCVNGHLQKKCRNKMENLIEYIKKRDTFLSIYNEGLRRSKKLYPESWNEIDEKELNSLNGRKKEIESLLQIIKNEQLDFQIKKTDIRIVKIKEVRKKWKKQY